MGTDSHFIFDNKTDSCSVYDNFVQFCWYIFNIDPFYTEAIENWRKEKLEEVKLAVVQGTSNSTIPHEEAGMNKFRCFVSDIWIDCVILLDEVC